MASLHLVYDTECIPSSTQKGLPMKHYIGIDIGGTAIKAGIIRQDGEVRIRWQEDVAMDETRSFSEGIWKIAGSAKDYADQKGIALSGIGVSSAGQINVRNGKVIGACGNIPDWIGTPLKGKLEEMLGLPTEAANDANCALLAECWLGSGAGYQHVVAYTIGTGVGGGILIDGKLLSGRDGIAGELGHMILRQGGEACSCGNHGCFERYGSMRALIRKAEEASGRSDLDGKIIFAEAEAGNEIFATCIEEFINLHADAVTGLVHLFNPEIVIIGGGVSAQGERLIAPLREKVRQRAMPAFAAGLIITTAKLGNDAGMIGAVKNFIEIKERDRL